MGSLFLAVAAIQGQTPKQTFNSLPPMAFDDSGPVLRAHAEPEKPLTVAGERGVLVGQQDGSFESWVLPVKLLSHLSIEAEIEGYTVPIDVNRQASEIEVRPDRTILTYSHIGFTVRQIMFSPNNAPPGTGPVVLFEFDCVRPTNFTFRFTPNLDWMWPRRNEGVPGVEWDTRGGFYVLHTDYGDFAGAVTIPGAQPGILAPYQERPQVHQVELKLHIDPVRDHGRLFPLLMAVATKQEAATNGALAATLIKLNGTVASDYKTHAESYKKLLAKATSIETPDKTLNDAFQWAVISIEQLKTKALPTDETALVAGYYASGDSARPGFGWFFGRDALYTLYAVNGYGDFALSKSELEFLINRQRDDGKIMHEYSQTAAAIDWKSFPYMYAAADATPLFLLAVADYVRSSGDLGFLTTHRDAIEKAWMFETNHAPGADKGGNGIYDNTQGTGWVESWPTGMPHQEIYLALLDEQASRAMARIEDLLKDAQKAEPPRQRAAAIAKTIESQFYDEQKSCYTFSRNTDGSLDRTSTVYPSLAWWSSVAPGEKYVAQPDGCLKQFAAHTLNTDWGLRDVANDEKYYDGMSYHQGSVWPLFTGWAALAEYRGGQPIAGYQMLMENANLTRAQDLGSHTELLSGDFFVPFGRSTSHQLWSSAMVITPTLRGLFGIDIDAQTKTITVNPHLPASWEHASIKNLRVGEEAVDLEFSRVDGEILVSRKSSATSEIHLRSEHAGTKSTQKDRVSIPDRSVDVGTIFQEPNPGDRTQSARVLRAEYGDRKLTIILEGREGSIAELPIVVRTPKTTVKVEGAELSAPVPHINLAPASQTATVHFPHGEGWKTVTVTLTW
jgi:glycogen debranching enzyme